MRAPLNALFDIDIPADIVLKSGAIQTQRASMFKVEETHIAGSVEKRKREFRAGRSLAREALEELGIGPCAIPVGPNREPIWPAMITGSVSHCSSLGVVALGLRNAYESIGVDIELNKPLPQDIPELIFTNHERNSLPGSPGVQNLDTLTFSAKETVFKCLFPILGFYFDFKEVSLGFDTAGKKFTAHLPARIAQQIGRGQLIGHYHTSESYILTLVYLEAFERHRIPPSDSA
jgi:4'-phosphopantetheinyl transferase EntD